MNAIETFFTLMSAGDHGSWRAAGDLALEKAWTFEVITDEEAEYRRVQAAACEEYFACDGSKPVRCGGLKAIEPSAGGNLKGWMAARVARLWRGRRSTLFEYQTKRRCRMTHTGDCRCLVRKKQRWETRDFIDLMGGDSPAHLSGFPRGPGGATMDRGVSGPRPTADERVEVALERTQWLGETAVLRYANRTFNFNGDDQ